jgi:hypothetical protein
MNSQVPLFRTSLSLLYWLHSPKCPMSRRWVIWPSPHKPESSWDEKQDSKEYACHCALGLLPPSKCCVFVLAKFRDEWNSFPQSELMGRQLIQYRPLKITDHIITDFHKQKGNSSSFLPVLSSFSHTFHKLSSSNTWPQPLQFAVLPHSLTALRCSALTSEDTQVSSYRKDCEKSIDWLEFPLPHYYPCDLIQIS